MQTSYKMMDPLTSEFLQLFLDSHDIQVEKEESGDFTLTGHTYENDTGVLYTFYVSTLYCKKTNNFLKE